MEISNKNCKKNIFLYNKENELITYVDLNLEGRVIGYYDLRNRILTKFNVHKFLERNKLYTDVKKAKIIFGEDCRLFHMFDEEESFCKVVKKNSLKLDPPIALSKIYTHNDEQFDGYTINPSFIQEWLKKL